MRLLSLALLATLAVASPHRKADLAGCVAAVFGDSAPKRIVAPTNETYLDARLGEKIQDEQLPVLIAYADDAEEIAPLIQCAQAAGVKAVPRTGGHSFEAYSSLNGTLVIDIAHINQVRVSDDHKSAVVGAGIRLGALYTALNEYDTTFIGGICPTVGLAGFLGSGGFNMQQRSQGLGVEHVLAAKVVLADGTTVEASPETNSDLFWAIRGGGGGSYGIAVEFTLSLTAIPRSALVLLTWNDTESRFPASQRYLDWAPKQVPEFMSQINVYRDTVQVLGWHYGGTEEELTALVETSGLLDIGTPEVIISGNCNTDNARIFGYTTTECQPDEEVDASILNVIPDPFTQVGDSPQFQWNEDPKSDSIPVAFPWERFYRLSKSFFVLKDRPLTDEVLQSLLDRIASLDEESEVWGEWHAWNITVPSKSDHAFAWRDQAYAHLEFQVHGAPDDAERQEAYEEWFADLESYLRPEVGVASYSGYVDADISTDPLESYYGDNVAELVAVKKKYDPEEFFTNPLAIKA
ncbi:FAD-binding oxidoreductase [Aspergillus lucknowensis]|uniref:FAD-binding PCMH-type domain-containing protein n=1 Tax=Aspergillus lucknowensis TaxID=176173 RepID=A0ABR4LWX0_9EURO